MNDVYYRLQQSVRFALANGYSIEEVRGVVAEALAAYENYPDVAAVAREDLVGGP